MTISLDLSKEAGISLDLSKNAPSLRHLKAQMTWDEHPIHAKSLTEGFDLDLFAFLLNDQNKIGAADHVVFYHNKDFGNGAIVIGEDDRTGGNGEEINIDLDKILPSEVASIAIYCFIFEAEKRKQHFGMMSNAKVSLIDNDTGAVIVQYDITKDFNGQTALTLGSISGKSFTPAPVDQQSGVLSPNDVLSFYN